MGVGFFAVLPMASPASSLSRSALRARDALVLEHLPLTDAIASTASRRLFPLVELEDLIQVAREAAHGDRIHHCHFSLCIQKVAKPHSVA